MPITFTPVVENYKRANMCWMEDNDYFYYPYVFISPFVTKITSRKAFPDAKLIIADSGGYQIRKGTKKDTDVDRWKVLQYQQYAKADIGLTLDLSPKSYKGNNIDDNIFQKFLKKSVDNANFALEQKTYQKMKTYPVLHGETYDTINKWFKATIREHMFKGFAMPISDIKGKNDVKNFCEQLEYVKSLGTDFHFLGNCSRIAIVTFSRLAHINKKQYTFDSSTVANSLRYGSYVDPFYLKKLSLTKDENKREKVDLNKKPYCWCPICMKHTYEELIYYPFLMLLHGIYTFQSFTHRATVIVQDDTLFHGWLEKVVNTNFITKRYADELIKGISKIL